MKMNSPTPVVTLKTFGLALALAALPVLLGASGCATGLRHQQSVGESISDQGLSARVRAALSEDTQYKYGGVTVETTKGIVQLHGYVNSRDQKNRAGELARRVSAVRDVFNHITVQESLN
jgi:osmotically-inducible protein OsmY